MTRVTETHTDLLKGKPVSLPRYPVEKLCAGQTGQSNSTSNAVPYNACIANNQEAYDTLKAGWAQKDSDARVACVRQTAAAANPGYDTLAQCLDAVEETKREAP
ncbi:hypothetical protein [Oecophyllibacter saccharovorans]|uniref:hypothetical protein n=1 Tax=Oecophyllibacter saccharovorans TaxID=2558360 RepID=UPI00116F732C|nr:hypothetical protein [Oecophyllibacter saccharovorans]TPW35083.1 hypothetical protein E3203_06325 [Oecophyllibacter saccharovorans]